MHRPCHAQRDVQPLSPEAAALSAEQADIEGPLVDWKSKGHSVKLLGRAELPGGAADELKVTLKSGVVRHVWVDAGKDKRVRRLFVLQFEGYNEAAGYTYDYPPRGVTRICRSAQSMTM